MAKAKVLGKGDLISAVSTKTKLSKRETELVLNTTLDLIKDTLKKGNTVRLIPFGSFEVRDRKGRMGRNPRTGEKIKIKARRVPAFKAGKELKTAVK